MAIRLSPSCSNYLFDPLQRGTLVTKETHVIHPILIRGLPLPPFLLSPKRSSLPVVRYTRAVSAQMQEPPTLYSNAEFLNCTLRQIKTKFCGPLTIVNKGARGGGRVVETKHALELEGPFLPEAIQRYLPTPIFTPLPLLPHFPPFLAASLCARRAICPPCASGSSCTWFAVASHLAAFTHRALMLWRACHARLGRTSLAGSASCSPRRRTAPST